MTWRVGKDEPRDIYDEAGRLVCRCESLCDAELIVRTIDGPSEPIETGKRRGLWAKWTQGPSHREKKA